MAFGYRRAELRLRAYASAAAISCSKKEKGRLSFTEPRLPAERSLDSFAASERLVSRRKLNQCVSSR